MPMHELQRRRLATEPTSDALQVVREAGRVSKGILVCLQVFWPVHTRKKLIAATDEHEARHFRLHTKEIPCKVATVSHVIQSFCKLVDMVKALVQRNLGGISSGAAW